MLIPRWNHVMRLTIRHLSEGHFCICSFLYQIFQKDVWPVELTGFFVGREILEGTWSNYPIPLRPYFRFLQVQLEQLVKLAPLGRHLRFHTKVYKSSSIIGSSGLNNSFNNTVLYKPAERILDHLRSGLNQRLQPYDWYPAKASLEILKIEFWLHREFHPVASRCKEALSCFLMNTVDRTVFRR